MSLVNYATREITCKIVYYGPGRSGKTSNLHYIYGQVPEDRKGKMVSLATQTDRTSRPWCATATSDSARARGPTRWLKLPRD